MLQKREQAKRGKRGKNEKSRDEGQKEKETWKEG